MSAIAFFAESKKFARDHLALDRAALHQIARFDCVVIGMEVQLSFARGKEVSLRHVREELVGDGAVASCRFTETRWTE